MNGNLLNNNKNQNMFKFFGPKKNKYFLIILFLIWLAIAAIYYGPKLLTYFGAPPPSPVAPSGEVHLGLYPETGTYKQGDPISVTVRLDTAQRNIVAVRAIIKYNQNIFTATGISFTGSAFADTNGCTGGICFTENVIDSANGEIRIAVGKPTTLTVRGVNTSNATVATINFTVKADAAPGTYNMTFGNTTQMPSVDSDAIEDNPNACITVGQTCIAGTDLLVASRTHPAVFTIQSAAYNPDIYPVGNPDGQTNTLDFTQYIIYYRAKDVKADIVAPAGIDTLDFTQYIILYRAVRS